MYLVRKIVVGVQMPAAYPWQAAELPAPSRAALQQALDLARAARLPVRLVTVLPEAKVGWLGSADQVQAALEQHRQAALTVLQELATEATGLADQIDCVVATGTAWMELLRAAGNAPQTLIVCGTRGTGRIRRALFGSTGSRLVRNAAGPVWLVSPREDQNRPLEILAATDLTSVGEDILLTAVSLSRQLPSRLHVVHVVDQMLERFLRRTGTPPEQLEDLRRKSLEQAEQAVHDQLAVTDFRTLPQGVQVHVTEGPADVSILNALRELNIDVLIMATHARGGMAGVVMGNTAESLLPDIPCSLIVVKPDDFVSPVQLPDSV